jgi:hypothetical protein
MMCATLILLTNQMRGQVTGAVQIADRDAPLPVYVEPADGAVVEQKPRPHVVRALGEFGAIILFTGNLEDITQTMLMAICLSFECNLGVALALSMVLIFVSLFC